MTDEQWIVYLYSIWPDGGWTVVWIILLLFVLGFLIVTGLSYIFDGHKGWYDTEKSLFLNHYKSTFVAMVTLLVFILISNLIPNRKGFLLLVATPAVMNVVKSDTTVTKLDKLDEILDLALDKATAKLKDK